MNFHFQHFEVKELESTIDNLRGDVDQMAKTVTQLTDGKGKPINASYLIFLAIHVVI